MLVGSHNFLFWLVTGLKLAQGKKLIFWSFQTILLCIVRGLARGGSVAVAVDVSDI